MGRRTQFARRRDRGRIRSIEVDVIVTYATSPILAAKHATSVIPIVFAAATDAVAAGLVASLARTWRECHRTATRARLGALPTDRDRLHGWACETRTRKCQFGLSI